MRKGVAIILPMAAAMFLLVFAVPVAAVEYDLTAGGTINVAASIGGTAILTTTDSQATGSGVIDSFVRISTNGNVEQGYNTSFRPLTYDENNSPVFTHDLPLSAVPIVNIGGTDYREFLLDINQTASNSLLSLDQVRIFLTNAGNQTGLIGSFGTEIFKLFASSGGGDSVKLDYNLNSGSGSGDLFLYVPNAAFVGGTYVTLYSKFGIPYPNNDGYEEWAVRTTTPVNIPEPGTALLLGSGLFGFAMLRRKFRK